MAAIEAWVVPGAGEALTKQQIDLGALAPEDVEIAVEHCGLCHSDLSVRNSDWGVTQYPAVLGHEVIGKVAAVGSAVKGIKIGQRVGVGWTSGSCMHCRQCMDGDQHLCANATATIVGHRGGFAQKVRAHWAWTIPIPGGVDFKEAGPLLCGGITVFNPIAMHAKPTHRVGVIGIGGLGHMALKFAAAWGCEVTAFTSESKFDEAKSLGAHHAVSSRDSGAIQKLAGSLDMIISTVNVPVDWDALIASLGPKGRLHVVGAVLEPIPVQAFPLIMGQKSISASPTGSPVDLATMLDFAARHAIAPQTEHLPMSRINEAFERLDKGDVRYRFVLDADF